MDIPNNGRNNEGKTDRGSDKNIRTCLDIMCDKILTCISKNAHNVIGTSSEGGINVD